MIGETLPNYENQISGEGRDEQIENLTEARKCVMNSFEIKKYQPDNN